MSARARGPARHRRVAVRPDLGDAWTTSVGWKPSLIKALSLPIPGLMSIGQHNIPTEPPMWLRRATHGLLGRATDGLGRVALMIAGVNRPWIVGVAPPLCGWGRAGLGRRCPGRGTTASGDRPGASPADAG